MKDIEDIIQFENENTTIDFKAIQYKRDKFENFLKDIISMANAKTREEKFIIIGVNHKSDGTRDIVGVLDDFIDEATYQQIVNENIEPEIDFKYYPHDFEGKKIGVFQINNTINPPYMLKKDFGKLNKGDSFIRKGSHQTRVTRKDIDYFIAHKIKENSNSFNGNIDIRFEEGGKKELSLKPVSGLEYPSELEAKKIEKILAEKEEKFKNIKPGTAFFDGIDNSLIGPTPYENRSISTLKKNLETIEEDFQTEDLHYLFEEKAFRLNLIITNTGNEYLVDASVEITIKKSGNFMIADRIFDKPPKRDSILSVTSIQPSWDKLHYPRVTETEKTYTIFVSIGDIKHKIPESVFQVPLRFVAGYKSINETIDFMIKIYGKNLPQAIEDKLILKIIDN